MRKFKIMPIAVKFSDNANRMKVKRVRSLCRTSRGSLRDTGIDLNLGKIRRRVVSGFLVGSNGSGMYAWTRPRELAEESDAVGV